MRDVTDECWEGSFPKTNMLWLQYLIDILRLKKSYARLEYKRKDEEIFHLSRKELVQTIQHDFINPSISTFPTPTTTNPVTVTVPPDTSTPGIITVPSVNPVTVTPNPASTPITFPPTVPITNPVNPPVPITNPVTTPSTTFPGGQPGSNTNPVTTYPTPTGGVPVTTPVVGPPVTTNAPAVPGQSWCVARSGVQETAVQNALDYACGMGGADCSAIQQGASCYNPNTMQNHASYAFNSYYQRNPVQTSCDFGGTAFITNVNPSSGSCIYSTWSSSSTSPNTASPITTTPMPTPTYTASPITTTPLPTPTYTASPITTTPLPTQTPTPTTASSTGATPISSGTPPTVLNAGNPALGGATTGFGENPPTANTSSTSMSNGLQPFIGCSIMVTFIITGRLVLDI